MTRSPSSDAPAQAGAGTSTPDLFAGGGELGALMRGMDWSATPLGPVESWPRALRTAVRIVLTARQPMFVWWGDQLINLYNDAYKAIVGGKHPQALGQPASVVWREIWDQIGPRAESAMSKNEGTYDEALLLIMERYGYPEETFYTFSYSPVPNEEGGTGGIFCANTDETQRIVGERQLALLRDLAAGTADARTIGEACRTSAESLASNPRDLPFALIYLVDPGQECLTLAGAAGIPPGTPAAPETAGLDAPGPWPLGEVVQSNTMRHLTDVSSLGALPAGAWDRPPTQAVVLPLAHSGATGRTGGLVVGLNPYRLLDDGYQGFLNLVAGQISAAIANAQVYEAERRRAEALAELDRAKTAFFSNVSHEFRTPLTLLLGPLEDLLARSDGTLPGADRNLVDVAHRNGLRLLRLVNTLLDFARIEAGRVQASYQPTDLSSVTTDLASSFRSAIDKAGLRLMVECPPLAAPVYVDRDMWEKIVLNLLSNAFKFTFEGEITVRLVGSADGRAAELTVQDTGTGVPAMEVARLFERFHRVRGARGRTHEGTGIGLALVQELVKHHGGSVAVESEVGRGTSFTVRVPFGTAHLPPDRIAVSSGLASMTNRADAFVEEALRWLPGAAEHLGAGRDRHEPAPPIDTGEVPAAPVRRRVLVADDNADMRDYVRRLLATEYEVTTASNGAEALAVARAGGIDLVLTDIMMPELDGFGLLRALRDDPETGTLPVILLSARAGEEARVEGLGAGADDYIVKPFAARELLARVGATLRLTEVRAEAGQAVRASEERYRSLVEATAQVIWSADSEGAFHQRSPSWEAYTGMSWEQYQGAGSFDAFHPDDRERLRSEWAAALAAGEPAEFRFRLRRADGVYRHMLGRGVPVREENGRVREWVGSITDIEDQRLAEERLRQAAKMEAIGRLAGGLAHDFNNQLQGVSGFVNFAVRDPGLGRQAREDLGEVRKAAERMASLTHQLLAFSRQQVLMPETLDLNAAVADSQALLQRLIGPTIEMEVRVPNPPAWVQVDRAQLLQVLMNLAINSRDAMPDGGTILIATGTRTVNRAEAARVADADFRAGDYATIRLSDTGSGIAAGDLPHIFEPFFTTKEVGEGTGLGLATVHGIVAQSRGYVSVESKPGQGTTFTVLLPLVPEPAEAVCRPAPGDRSTGRKATILVVDDEDVVRLLMRRTLVAEGYEVLTARDGREALDCLGRSAGKVDLVLSDLVMPVMGGRELGDRLAADYPHLPVIWMSGYPRDSGLLRNRMEGEEPFLQKPITAEQLVGMVRELLERRGR